MSERRTTGERVVPFRVEGLDDRQQDQAAFDHGLERDGLPAVQEYRAAL